MKGRGKNELSADTCMNMLKVILYENKYLETNEKGIESSIDTNKKTKVMVCEMNYFEED